MGYDLREKNFKEKLNEMGLEKPKIVKSPSGLYIAYPQPGSTETGKASYYEDDEGTHYEYTNDSEPKKY